MRTYGRWQGYAWSVVVVAGGAAYALSAVLRVDDDDGGGGVGEGSGHRANDTVGRKC